MKLTPQQLDAIAWLVQGIRMYATDYRNNKDDMEECLMKISAYAYAVETILEGVDV